MTPPLRSMDIAKLAVGQKILRQETFSDWEAVLSEIIVGDAFGVDRIDYLLRGLPPCRRSVRQIRPLPALGHTEDIAYSQNLKGAIPRNRSGGYSIS